LILLRVFMDELIYAVLVSVGARERGQVVVRREDVGG